jgi:putative flippase GtrA
MWARSHDAAVAAVPNREREVVTRLERITRRLIEEYLIRFPVLLRLARFLCVGCVGLGIDSTLFSGLYPHQSAPVARAVSMGVATVATWYLNRTFTFGPSRRAPFVEMARYAGVACLAQGVNYAIFLALLFATHAAFPLACLFASAVMTAGLSFTGQSLFAFAHQPWRPAAAGWRVTHLRRDPPGK